MSILTEPLQESINIDGVDVEINTAHNLFIDFLQGLLFSDEDRTLNAMISILGDVDGINAKSAIDALYMFAFPLAHENCKAASSSERLFCYDSDADVILADFQRYYNIDLTVCVLHWHRFSALLNGLPKDSGLCERQSIRSIKSKKDATSKGYSWEGIQKYKKQIALDGRTTEAENKLLAELDELFYNA